MGLVVMELRICAVVRVRLTAEMELAPNSLRNRKTCRMYRHPPGQEKRQTRYAADRRGTTREPTGWRSPIHKIRRVPRRQASANRNEGLSIANSGAAGLFQARSGSLLPSNFWVPVCRSNFGRSARVDGQFVKIQMPLPTQRKAKNNLYSY